MNKCYAFNGQRAIHAYYMGAFIHEAFMTQTYSGIDYSCGLANLDTETGIRYGVIESSSLPASFWETMQSEGADLSYQDAIDSIKENVVFALKSALSDCSANCDYEQLAETVMDAIEIEFENADDFTRYRYEDKEKSLILETTSSGSVFVIKSPFYTLCSYCSPCAPGAGYLTSEGNVKAYCLGAEWFDSDDTLPYHVFSV